MSYDYPDNRVIGISGEDQARTTWPNERRRPRIRMPGSALVLSVVGVIWLTGPFGLGGLFGLGQSNFTLADRTVAGAQLDMIVAASDVAVRSWGGRDIRVRAIQRGGSRGDVTVTVNRVGSTVRVSEQEKPCSFFCHRSVHYDVWIPANARARVQTTSGDVSADGLQRGFIVETASGDVTLHDIAGSLQIQAASGDVKLTSGGVTDAAITTTSGSIELAGVAHRLHLESASGDINVHDARDATLDVSAASGDVDVTGSLAAGLNNKVRSMSGGVTLRLPAASGFHLDATTTSGDVTSGFTLTHRSQDSGSLKGDAGDGRTALTIDTISGDISLYPQ